MKKIVTLMLILSLSLCPVVVKAQTNTKIQVPMQTIPATFAYGDINSDNAIDASDALLALRHSAGMLSLSPEQQDKAEVSGDTLVNALDALCILKHAVGKMEFFPANAPLENAKLIIKSYRPEKYEQGLWKEKLEEIETRYNASITIVSTEDKSSAALSQGMLDGTETADVLEVSVGSARQLYKKKATVNLMDQPLHTAVTNNAFTQSLTVGNHRFGAVVDPSAAPIQGIFYNKDLLAKYAPDYDLDTLYDQKEWTFDTFAELAKLCTVDTDGNGNADIYGFISNKDFIFMTLEATSGGIAVMEQNHIQATVLQPVGTKALNRCRNLFRKDRTWAFYANIMDGANAFINQESAMFVSSWTYIAATKQSLDFSIGFIPMPLESGRTEYQSSAKTAPAYVIPADQSDTLSAACVLLNELAVIQEELLTEKIQQLKPYGFSEQDMQHMRATIEQAIPDYSDGVISNQSLHDIPTVVLDHCHCDTSDGHECLSAVQKELDDFYGEFYDPPLIAEP